MALPNEKNMFRQNRICLKAFFGSSPKVGSRRNGTCCFIAAGLVDSTPALFRRLLYLYVVFSFVFVYLSRHTYIMYWGLHLSLFIAFVPRHTYIMFLSLYIYLVVFISCICLCEKNTGWFILMKSFLSCQHEWESW